MKIYIASDHGGFELKDRIISELGDIYNLQDLGPFALNETDDYPDFAELVAQKVVEDQSFGILICRSGNGMVIAANKFKGAYAALCFTKHHAQMARKDDNANILCLDADYSDHEFQLDIVQGFLGVDFEGMETRHGRRFKKVQDIEDKNFK